MIMIPRSFHHNWFRRRKFKSSRHFSWSGQTGLNDFRPNFHLLFSGWFSMPSKLTPSWATISCPTGVDFDSPSGNHSPGATSTNPDNQNWTISRQIFARTRLSTIFKIYGTTTTILRPYFLPMDIHILEALQSRSPITISKSSALFLIRFRNPPITRTDNADSSSLSIK